MLRSFMDLVKGPWEKNWKIFVFGEFHSSIHYQKSFTWQDDKIWLIVFMLGSIHLWTSVLTQQPSRSRERLNEITIYVL